MAESVKDDLGLGASQAPQSAQSARISGSGSGLGRVVLGLVTAVGLYVAGGLTLGPALNYANPDDNIPIANQADIRVNEHEYKQKDNSLESVPFSDGKSRPCGFNAENEFVVYSGLEAVMDTEGKVNTPMAKPTFEDVSCLPVYTGTQ